MISYNENEKRKIIMDYYSNPRARVEKPLNDELPNIYLHSSSCVDEMTLYYDLDKNEFNFIHFLDCLLVSKLNL